MTRRRDLVTIENLLNFLRKPVHFEGLLDEAIPCASPYLSCLVLQSVANRKHCRNAEISANELYDVCLGNRFCCASMVNPLG